MSQPIVDIRNATFAADRKPLIRDITWAIHPGQHWAVLGQNGCGKTTLLRTVTGYLWPNRGGEVTWLGDPKPDLRELRTQIGWVTSMLAAEIPPREEVLELVVSGRAAQLGQRPPIRIPAQPHELELGRQLLEQVAATQLIGQKFVTLSQGEKQKVLLARALIAEPLLLVLDEPCAGLDPGARELFLTALSNVLDAAEAPTMVFVTHHIEEVLPQVQNVLVMSQGEIVQRGTKDDVLTVAGLSRVHDHPPQRIEQSNGRYWPIW